MVTINLDKKREPRYNMFQVNRNAEERRDNKSLEEKLRRRILDFLPIQVPELEMINVGNNPNITYSAKRVYFNDIFITGLCAAFRIVDTLGVEDFVMGFNPDLYNIGKIVYGPNFAGYFELELYKSLDKD